MKAGTLKWYIVLSAALHGMLLVIWRPPAFETGYSGSTLQLAMTERTASAAVTAPGHRGSVAAEPANGPATPRKPHLATSPTTPAASHSPSEYRPARTPGIRSVQPHPPQSRAAAGGEAPDARSSTANGEEADRHLRKSLFELVTARLTYPLLARRKGWQGTVRLELHIEPDGQISRLRIDTTSGYPLLDQAALRALRLASIPHAGRWLNGRAVDIVIPVEYRLLDG